jgi:hypothetical protein
MVRETSAERWTVARAGEAKESTIIGAVQAPTPAIAARRTSALLGAVAFEPPASSGNALAPYRALVLLARRCSTSERIPLRFVLLRFAKRIAPDHRGVSLDLRMPRRKPPGLSLTALLVGFEPALMLTEIGSGCAARAVPAALCACLPGTQHEEDHRDRRIDRERRYEHLRRLSFLATAAEVP